MVILLKYVDIFSAEWRPCNHVKLIKMESQQLSDKGSASKSN